MRSLSTKSASADAVYTGVAAGGTWPLSSNKAECTILPTPILSGASFQIDPDNGAYYLSPAVATLDDGRIATVYRNGGDGLEGNLRYVLHNADGTIAFEQDIVDTDDDVFVDNEMVDMAALPGGGFVIVWSERDGNAQNIYHRIFGADGQPLGEKIHSNADMPDGYAQRPDVVSDGKGGFYIAWDDMHYHNGDANIRSVRLQHYGADGQPTAPSERISDNIGADSNAAIAISRDGTRVNVIWDDNLGLSTNNSDGIYGIEFGGTETFYRADKGDFSEFHTDPDIAYSTGTTFMTVWNEYVGANGYAVYGSINGGDEFQINTMAHTHWNTIQKVVGLRDGNFLVVWTDNGFDGNDDVNGQLISSTGEKIGEEFRISDRASNYINRITASETIDGRVVVTWDSPDGDIFGRMVDPRQGAISWTGDESAEQFTGTNFADTLNGGDGDDVIQGLGGADIIDGGNSSDTASYDLSATGVFASLLNPAGNLGDAAGDTYTSIENLKGSRHGDTLIGDNNLNNLFGLDGNDLLQGEGGGDYLVGGAGDDVLSGDEGGDVMLGGAGGDVFLFSTLKDAPIKGMRDQIMDFIRNEDVIDLRRLDANEDRRRDQEFDFIGTQKFHKEAGELRYEVKGGEMIISGDTDGNGKADFSILLDELTKIRASDFAL